MNTADPKNEITSFRGTFRREYTCTFSIEGPWRIGTGESMSADTDAPVFKTSEGLPGLTGKSVKGILKDFCAREWPVLGLKKQSVVILFGPEPGSHFDSSDQKNLDRQGRLTVGDPRPCHGSTEIRDFCRHDRKNGAAQKGGKFDAECSVGTQFSMKLIYEGDSGNDEEIKLLESSLNALLKDRILPVGSKSSCGFGFITQGEWKQEEDTDHLSIIKQRLKEFIPGMDQKWMDCLNTSISASPNSSSPGTENQEAMDAAASDPVQDPNEEKGQTNKPANTSASSLSPYSWIDLSLSIQCEGPMLIGAPVSGHPGQTAGYDAAKGKYLIRSDGKIPLTGSSLRGSFQAQARRIASAFDASIIAAADCLFGISGSNDQEDAKKGIVMFGEGTLIGTPKELLSMHVAIDRLTGFSAESRLYSDCSLMSPKFTLRLVLRWATIDDPVIFLALGLFFATLGDFCQGVIPVGSRVTKGYGQVSVAYVDRMKGSMVVRNGDTTQRQVSSDYTREPAHDCFVWMNSIPPTIRTVWEEHNAR